MLRNIFWKSPVIPPSACSSYRNRRTRHRTKIFPFNDRMPICRTREYQPTDSSDEKGGPALMDMYMSSGTTPSGLRSGYETTFLTQLQYLCGREWKMLKRDKTLFLAHVLVAAFLGVFCGEPFVFPDSLGSISG